MPLKQWELVQVHWKIIIDIQIGTFSSQLQG